MKLEYDEDSVSDDLSDGIASAGFAAYTATAYSPEAIELWNEGFQYLNDADPYLGAAAFTVAFFGNRAFENFENSWAQANSRLEEEE